MDEYSFLKSSICFSTYVLSISYVQTDIEKFKGLLIKIKVIKGFSAKLKVLKDCNQNKRFLKVPLGGLGSDKTSQVCRLTLVFTSCYLISTETSHAASVYRKRKACKTFYRSILNHYCKI